MLGERRRFLFLRMLELKSPRTHLCKFDGEGARPSWWYWLRTRLSRKRLIDGKLATSKKDLPSQPPSV
jgi:hypothetical protein